MIRKDGFYINYIYSDANGGTDFDMSTILFFTKNDFVLFINDKGIINPESIPLDIINEDFGLELTNELGKYTLSEKKIKITFPLRNEETINNEYHEFSGQIVGNTLVLDYSICNWSEKENNYSKRTLTTKQVFKFYSFSENKFIAESFEKQHVSFEKQDINNINNNKSQNNEIKNHNRNRRIIVALFFGFFGGFAGALFGGFTGFFIGLLVGVSLGLIIESIAG